MAKTKKGNRPGIRRVGRTIAFQVLYGDMFSNASGPDALAESFRLNPMVEEEESETAREFAYGLVTGVAAELEKVDELIERHSKHWKIGRIAKIELCIMRLAVYEMAYTDIPNKAAINEAIELSKSFGDENSRGFINGILDAVGRDVEKGK